MSINHNPLLNHLIKKPQKRVNGVLVKVNKAESRLRRSRGICQSRDYDEFLSWINDLQQRLGLKDQKFANLLGISIRSLYRYKGRTGVLPSKKVWNRLKEIDRVAESYDMGIGYNIRVIKYKINLRGK